MLSAELVGNTYRYAHLLVPVTRSKLLVATIGVTNSVVEVAFHPSSVNLKVDGEAVAYAEGVEDTSIVGELEVVGLDGAGET